jgi:TRAP-type mannitol/chloroaromatic compound transport system permease large subunit
MGIVLLLPWDFFVVGATNISHEEDIFFNQFLNPFLDKSEGIVKESIPLPVIYRGFLPFLISDSVRLIVLCLFPSLWLRLPSILR